MFFLWKTRNRKKMLLFIIASNSLHCTSTSCQLLPQKRHTKQELRLHESSYIQIWNVTIAVSSFYCVKNIKLAPADTTNPSSCFISTTAPCALAATQIAEAARFSHDCTSVDCRISFIYLLPHLTICLFVNLQNYVCDVPAVRVCSPTATQVNKAHILLVTRRE